MTHHESHEEHMTAEPRHHERHHEAEKSVSFSLGAKSLFFGGFVVGLLVMAIPATFFASRALGGVPDGTGSPPTVQNAPSPTDSAPAATQPTGKVKPLSKEDHVFGDAKAKVTLIAYSDYECPFCKRFHPTLQQLKAEYKDKVSFVFRHFPLSFHANAQKEAEAAECVATLGGSDKFWTFTDKIFERTTSNGTGFALDQLGPLAKEVGVDEAKFKECLDGGKQAARVQQDFNEGQAAGVDGTPGTILLGKSGKSVLIPGAVPLETIKSQIDQLLAQEK